MKKNFLSTPLVIAIMAFGIVAFLFLIDTSMNPDGSKKTTNTVSSNTNAVVSNQNTNTSGVNTNSTVLANNTNEHTDIGTADADPTAGWKTYTNTTYKYSIQYPTDYSLASTPNGAVSVVFQKGQPGQVGYQFVTVTIVNDSDTTLVNWAKKGFPIDDPATTYHANPTKVSYREDFIRTDGDQGSSGIPEYLAYHNNQVYSLTSFPGTIDQTSNVALIKTFTFTD